MPFNVGYGNHEYDFNNTSSKPFSIMIVVVKVVCVQKLYPINDYYSYNIGNTYYIDTEIYYDYNSLQYKWLDMV